MFRQNDPAHAVLVDTAEGHILANLNATGQEPILAVAQFADNVIILIDYSVARNANMVVVDTTTDETYYGSTGDLLLALPISPKQVLAFGRPSEMPGIFVLDVTTGESTRVLEGAYVPIDGLSVESLIASE